MKKEPKIKIFVVHHKPWYIYEDDVYIPIQVGKKNAKVDLWILWDDTWDNISDRNSQYAELTAQYWVWKNYDLSDVDYVWFCHYRRYMTYCYNPNIFNHLITRKNPYWKREDSSLFLWKWKSLREYNHICEFDKNILKNNSQNIKNFIEKNPCDVYTLKRKKILKLFWFKFGIEPRFWFVNHEEVRNDAVEFYVKTHKNQWNIIKWTEKEYKGYYPFNRHIYLMKREFFLMYMEWLFKFLFGFEEILKNKKYDWFFVYERFMAIFSEPLITYWLYYMQKINNIKVLSDANQIMFV